MSIEAQILRELNEKLAGLVEMKRLFDRLGYSEDKTLTGAVAKAEATIKAEVVTSLEG